MEHLNKILFYCSTLLFVLTTSSSAIDTLFPNQTLKDGDTIVSAGEIFELGFFSPGNSSLRYVGIWYKITSADTVVWVANREFPVVNPTGMLKVNDKGILQLLSMSNTLVWSSLSSALSRNINPVAQLLDSGNLVIRDDINGSFVWQSFDHPGDTLLPGMKLGVDLVTGINRTLTSWSSSNDPSSGFYTVWTDTKGNPQLYESNGVNVFSRLGFWNGMGFTGMRGLGQSSFYKFEFVLNTREIYYAYELVSNSFLTRITLDPDGRFNQLIWSDQKQTWVYSMMAFLDNCDRYGICGVYGSCNINNAPACNCFEGFEPVQPKDWYIADWTSGCQRSISVSKENEHYFKKFTNLKLPDTQGSWFNITMSLQECENACIASFLCTAYANSDIRGGGSGCLLWFSDLIDIREAPLNDVSGQDLYMKMAVPNLTQDKKEKGEKKKKKSHLKLTLSIVFGVVLLSFTLILYAWRRNKSSHDKGNSNLQAFTI